MRRSGHGFSSGWTVHVYFQMTEWSLPNTQVGEVIPHIPRRQILRTYWYSSARDLVHLAFRRAGGSVSTVLSNARQFRGEQGLLPECDLLSAAKSICVLAVGRGIPKPQRTGNISEWNQECSITAGPLFAS